MHISFKPLAAVLQYINVCVHVRMHACMYICMCIYMYVCLCVYTLYACIYIYTQDSTMQGYNVYNINDLTKVNSPNLNAPPYLAS